MKKGFIASLLCIITYCLPAQQAVTSKNYTIFQTKNGLNILYVQSQPSATEAEVVICVRAGSIHERQEQRGLSAVVCEMIANRTRQLIEKYKSYPIRFEATPGIENCLFRFSSPSQSFSTLMEIAALSMQLEKVSEKELEAAVNRCMQAKQLQEKSNEDVTEAIKRHQLFKFDKEKIAIWQSDSLLRRYTALDADSFYRLFYSPFSASVLVRTSLPFSQVNSLLEKNFDRWIAADFNPDEIIKIRSIKPMIYTTQNTVLNKSSKHKLSFHTLTFGSRNYARGTYDTYLLSAFLTDSSNKLFQQLKQNTGVRAISTFFDVHNYYGILTVSVELPDTEHRNVYEELRKAIDSAYRYVNDSTLASAKRKFAQEYIVWAKSPDFYYKSLQHFFSNFTEYYETLNDSVQQVPLERFRRFVYNQFSRASFAIIAETDSFHYKNENYEDWMADVDERIGEERFTFRKNICEIEGDENKRLLSRLIQWLKINPDIQCQVNGKADRNEYDKFKDAAVWAFIDTIETFKKYKPDLMKTGIMRPELLRALKILKALYEGGISLERLSGTAMPLNSKTKEEEAANRVATLSLTRLKTLAPLRN